MSEQNAQYRGDATSFYVHRAKFDELAPEATQTTEIKIEADSDFFVYKLAYFADIAAAGQTDSSRVVPLVNVLITDGGSDRQLMRSPVPVPTIFGTGEIPFILPAPHRFRASSTISVAVTNFDEADTYNLTLALIGFKKFVRG